MKTLNNYLILYDAECPMCELYTQKMVDIGMLSEDGRAPYQNTPQTACPLVDRQRAVNEIALVDTVTGEVTYGVQSLFKVIGNSFPFLDTLFANSGFAWLMSKLYAFISYNRRVIVSASVTAGYAIQPTFRLNYRIAYLIITWITVGFILSKYACLLADVTPLGSNYREYLICGGQVLFQGLIITLYAPAKRWDYLGHMMTISLGGAILLLPALLVAQLLTFPALFYVFYFMAIAGLMFLEHLRRTHILHLGWLLTATWVIYRLAILVIIYKIN